MLCKNQLFVPFTIYMAFAFADCIHTAWIHNRKIIPSIFRSNELVLRLIITLIPKSNELELHLIITLVPKYLYICSDIEFILKFVKMGGHEYTSALFIPVLQVPNFV